MLYVATAICNKPLKTYCIYMCHYTYALLEAVKQNSSKLKSRSFKRPSTVEISFREYPCHVFRSSLYLEAADICIFHNENLHL